MKMKQNALSIFQNKVLQKMLIYYYYWVLKISIMFWLKVLIGLWLIKQKHHDKKHLCWYCLQCSLAQVLYVWRHVKHWLAINHTKSNLLPEEYEYVNFEYLKRLTKRPFIIFGDFKFILIPWIDNIEFGRNNDQNNIVDSYGYKIVFVDDWYSKLYKTYFPKDVINKFLNDKRKWILF